MIDPKVKVIMATILHCLVIFCEGEIFLILFSDCYCQICLAQNKILSKLLVNEYVSIISLVYYNSLDF